MKLSSHLILLNVFVPVSELRGTFLFFCIQRPGVVLTIVSMIAIRKRLETFSCEIQYKTIFMFQEDVGVVT